MTQHTIAPLSRYNWDGDEIIHESIVPSSRPIVATKGKTEYDIDVREYLVTEKNEVMRRTLHDVLRSYVAALPWGNWPLFNSRQPGSFDHRADVIASFVFERIRYKVNKGMDPWRFPDEVLSLRYGDCEDRSFLLASLLLASGISSFNVRVALGKVRYSKEVFDHVWVMYKNETGAWMILEPLLQSQPPQDTPRPKARRTRRVRFDRAEYSPYFLFNDIHLWAVKRSDQPHSFRSCVELRNTWHKFDPTFAGEVHQSILKEALSKDLKGQPVSSSVASFANILNGYFHSILGNTIDNIDSPRKYDPLEHFDNSLIEDAWALSNQRLSSFKKNRDPFTFALAAHGICDFYAHSSYAHFMPPDSTPTDPSPACKRYSAGDFNSLSENLRYDASSRFDLGTKDFSINTHHWQGKLSQRPGKWRGKLLSGRYAQVDDYDRPNPGLFDPAQLVGDATEVSCRKEWDSMAAIARHPDIACAPHHNEIAVDDESQSSQHVLYDGAKYSDQFTLRRNTATLHVREVFFNNWSETPSPV